MTAQAVEWALVVHYGPAAHQPTYGRRVREGGYTKDYIQLSKKSEFLDAVSNLFSVTPSATSSVPLTYRWPTGSSPGTFVFKSADRPHLKWETSHGAPRVWKMTLAPSDSTAETIPGDPSHVDFDAAEKEFSLLASRGAGQPYLMAIKLRDEPRTLHLRVYLGEPTAMYAWADLGLTPQAIRDLAAKTSQQSAIAWSVFHSGGTVPSSTVDHALSLLAATEDRMAVLDALEAGTGRALATYVSDPGHGIFFDPTQNHDAWVQPAPLFSKVPGNVDDLLKALKTRFPPVPQGDLAAEALDADPEETEAFSQQIDKSNYAVPDSTTTIKTRGSAQKAFATAVKGNYGYRCAITGIASKGFLVAAHIVPWSEDQDIRLDPANGICLSLLVDRAFENGHLLIADDLTVSIDWHKVGSDDVLKGLLSPYDGQKVTAPTKGAPNPAYLQRRRALVNPTG